MVAEASVESTALKKVMMNEEKGMVGVGFGAFERQLERALRSDIDRLMPLWEGENVYGLALVSDPFIENLQLMINSEASLLREIDKYEERFGEITPEKHQQYRWTPSLWHYSHANIPAPELLQINQYLYNKNVEDFANFELQFYESLIKVLKKMDREGFFTDRFDRDALTLFISIANDERAPFFEEYAAGELNDPPIASQFKARFKVG